MSNDLKGNRRSPVGSRVPTTLLPNAIRWERARARLFSAYGDRDNADYASGLVFHYQRRAMEECLDPGPT